MGAGVDLDGMIVELPIGAKVVWHENLLEHSANVGGGGGGGG